jgi:hypothetical protein
MELMVADKKNRDANLSTTSTGTQGFDATSIDY